MEFSPLPFPKIFRVMKSGSTASLGTPSHEFGASSASPRNMTQPIRIQRKRAKGFDLQKESIGRNGLPCVYVGRPGRWGNPFRIEFSADEFYKQQCVDAFRALLTRDYKWFRKTGFHTMTAGVHFTWQFKTDDDIERFLEPLRGKNLACWCKEDATCHADILLELANR